MYITVSSNASRALPPLQYHSTLIKSDMPNMISDVIGAMIANGIQSVLEERNSPKSIHLISGSNDRESITRVYLCELLTRARAPRDSRRRIGMRQFSSVL